ncbi:hypothetical protein, partial [Tepidiforma sp.]|uniref:hypothetical protein n=1 Tax=Tepidiforma sp. TaxID=2682230 RepID=UPI0026228765
PLGHLLGDLFEAQDREELVELLREARASQLPQSDRARVWRDAVDRARVLGLTPEQLRSAL